MPGVHSLLYRMLLAVTLLCALAAPCHAQPQTSPSTAPQPIALSASSLPLVGPWHFEPGDSPQSANGPLWAQPTFNDSQWSTLTLPATSASTPGWMGRGYPTLDRGYAWYRLTLRPAKAAEPLWLKMPASYDDAYQVYANGQLVGSAGFRGKQPVAFYSNTYSFALPPPDANGNLTLALRLWLDPNTRFDSPSAGGLHAPPLVGLASTISAAQTRDDDTLILNKVAMEGFLPFFYLLAAAASLWAWLKVRHEQAYLWLAIRLLINVSAALIYVLALAGHVSQTVANTLLGVVIRAVLTPCWIVFWWHWFQLKRERWILSVTVLLTILDALSALCARATVHGTIPMQWAAWLGPANTLIKFGELSLLAIIFAKGFRRDRTEALLALFPLAINEIDIFNGFSLESRFGWHGTFFGMWIPPSGVASFILVLTIGILAIRRFLAIHAERLLAQQTLEAELVQASELQKRVLVPERKLSPFFSVETAYRPARTVGGDFFQVLSNPAGATLVVLGDVSGKGVTAAFLVAVLVGAMRTRAEQSLDPAGMLQLLNERLIDRSEGHFATCLAIHINPDGAAAIANAGHLFPYLNGEEVPTSGALPLGLVPEADISLLSLQLQPGDRLTLVSDGVVEATNDRGELLGFDRTRACSQASAQQIADRAEQFGQEDDITVVSVQFLGPAQEVVAA